MLAAVVRGTVFAVSTALGLTGCFSASFLDDTCERLPGGCGGVSTGGSTSGTGSTSGGEVPTTSGTTTELSSVGSSSGTTGESLGLLFEGPAFRIDEMRIVDPHLFISEFACVDAFSFINSGLTTTTATKETNLIFLAKDFDPDAATQEFWFYRAADCPQGEDYCLLDDLVPPTVFVSFNRDTEDCFTVDNETINPASLIDLTVPTFPCVVSPKASLPVQLTPELSPITFYQGQFAAHYEPDDQNPTELRDAILYGFIPKSEAETLSYNYNNMPINLWSVVRGSDHPDACPEDLPGNPSDVDFVDLNPDDMLPAEAGVYLYLNFKASKIDFYAPPPP